MVEKLDNPCENYKMIILIPLLHLYSKYEAGGSSWKHWFLQVYVPVCVSWLGEARPTRQPANGPGQKKRPVQNTHKSGIDLLIYPKMSNYS